jgi:hypothetical protein
VVLDGRERGADELAAPGSTCQLTQRLWLQIDACALRRAAIADLHATDPYFRAFCRLDQNNTTTSDIA